MARQFKGHRLVIASHNPGKVREIGDLLEGRDIELVSAGDLNISEPEETGKTFEENAILKAIHSAQASKLPALADDSGLAVHALDGDPGIYSARWGGAEKDFDMAMEKVTQTLGNAADRSAHFACALALAWPDGHTEYVLGTVAGDLVWPPRGTHGFGYDPIFVANGHIRTFGEMAPEDKHTISHRADAFRKLLARCFSSPQNG